MLFEIRRGVYDAACKSIYEHMSKKDEFLYFNLHSVFLEMESSIAMDVPRRSGLSSLMSGLSETLSKMHRTHLIRLSLQTKVFSNEF